MSTRVACPGSSVARPLRSFSGGLLKAVFAALLLCTSALNTVQAAVSVPRHLISPDTPTIDDPDSLVLRYLDAVDRGELQIFGKKLDRSMIVPVRVEYVYDLSSRAMRTRIYSNLKEPLPVPGQPGCQILGVSAVMEDDHITEIESHIWMKP